MLVNPIQIASGLKFAVLIQSEYDTLKVNGELEESTIYLVVEEDDGG